MSILQLPHAHPEVVLFDWHATLVDTHDAMYHAVDDVLPRLRELDLWDDLLHPDDSKTLEDAKLLTYVRDFEHLHPKIVAQRKISRTDIFEVLFGNNPLAKARAHHAFDESYRKYVSEVHPLEDDTRQQLQQLHKQDLTVGLISNRRRDYLEHELSLVDKTGWTELFDVIVSGSDVDHRKPSPDVILKALEWLEQPATENCWYVGDSTTDVIAAKQAGVTAVFYNGANWEASWLDKIFPCTAKHPHRPDAVIHNLAELNELARDLLEQSRKVTRLQKRQAAHTRPH